MDVRVSCCVFLLATLALAGGCKRSGAGPSTQNVAAGGPPISSADKALSDQLVGVWKGTVASPSGHADKDSYEEYKPDGTVTDSLISPDMPSVKFTGTYAVKDGKLLLRYTRGFGAGSGATDFSVTATTLTISGLTYYRQPAGTIVPDAPEAFTGNSSFRAVDRSGGGYVATQPPVNQPPVQPPQNSAPPESTSNSQPGSTSEAPQNSQPPNTSGQQNTDSGAGQDQSLPANTTAGN